MIKYNKTVMKEVAECTQNNDHCYAYILASKMLSYSELERKFLDIDSIATIRGCYDEELMAKRYSLYKELMASAEYDLSESEYKSFYGAF